MRIINTTTGEYPVQFYTIRENYPNTSFTYPLVKNELEPIGYSIVSEIPKPICNRNETIEEGTPEEINGVWTQVWNIRPASLEELQSRCDYYSFWDALIISNVYQKLRSQAVTSLNVNTCCTEFIAALTDAKAGRANIDAIQTCINLLLSAWDHNAQDIIELEEIFAVGNLDLIYTISQL